MLTQYRGINLGYTPDTLVSFRDENLGLQLFRSGGMLAGRSRRISRKKTSTVFYWTRPLGAPDGFFRLVATTRALWGCRHLSAASLTQEIVEANPKCNTLEIELSDFSIDQGDWIHICDALCSCHASHIRQARFVKVPQDQLIWITRQLADKGSRLESVEVLSRESFPDMFVGALANFFSGSLRKFVLLDPAHRSMIFRPDSITTLLETCNNLQSVCVAQRIAITDLPRDCGRCNLGFGKLLDALQACARLETVEIHIACLENKEAEEESKPSPRTLKDLLRSDDASDQLSPRTVGPLETVGGGDTSPGIYCGKDSLEFTLLSNWYRRVHFDERSNLESCEKYAVIDKGLGVVQDWYRSNHRKVEGTIDT